MSEHHPDWEFTVNKQLLDHEKRLAVVERMAGVTPDDIDNHDRQLRAIEHRIAMLEVELRELRNAHAGADGV